MSNEKNIDDCWNTIGCWGDQLPRCEKLDQYGHCFNCSVYSGAGRRLLDREAPEGYLEEWRNLLHTVEPERDTQISSILIFSMWGKYFALPTRLLVKVTEFQPIHRIPHSSHHAVLGITNIVGELLVAISLLSVIQAAGYRVEDDTHENKRNIVLHVAEHQWAVPVQEVMGIHKIDMSEFKTHVLSVHSACITACFKWQKEENEIYDVAYIDEDKLSSALEELRF